MRAIIKTIRDPRQVLAGALRGARLTTALALTVTAMASPSSSHAADASAGAEAAAPRVLAQNGLEVLLYPLSRGADGYKVVTVVRADGLKPFVTEIDTYRLSYGPHVAIGKLSSMDAHPSALLRTFTGGAHCCTVVTVVTAMAGQLQAIEIGAFDGDPLSTFPTDLDGDGTADFQMRDDQFLYQFAPYSGSWAPPRILNVVAGKVVDVSTRPAFRKLTEAFAERAKAACTNRSNPGGNGACAAYVAVQARLGGYAAALEAVRPFISRSNHEFLPIGCKDHTLLAECPEDQQIRFTEFEPALEWFLKHAGYLN